MELSAARVSMQSSLEAINLKFLQDTHCGLYKQEAEVLAIALKTLFKFKWTYVNPEVQGEWLVNYKYEPVDIVHTLFLNVSFLWNLSFSYYGLSRHL